MILSAVYMLWMFQRVNYGSVSEKNASLTDLTRREWTVVGPLVALTVLMGVLPNVFLRPMAPSVDRFLTQVRQGAPIQARATPGWRQGNAGSSPSGGRLR